MPQLGTYDEMAAFSTQDWWVNHGGPRHWDIDPGGTLTVNIANLTPGGKTMALTALQFWADVADIKFVVTTGPAKITYDDDEPGAFYKGTKLGAFFTSASVNVDVNWDNGVKTLDSPAFAAMLHETGHALGLGHLGHYDGGGVKYATDAFFTNDSWQVSTMSYFFQASNPTVNASTAWNLVPMIVDIIAVQSLYGAAPDTRSGDTVYGFGSTAGALIYDAESFPDTPISITIYDTGGIDTFDYSGFADNQIIDLKAEGISSIGGLIGNLIIARGVDIENAKGGSGVDKLLGNELSNRLIGGEGGDTLQGGLGADTLDGGAGSDTASFWNPASGVVASLVTGATSDGDSLIDIEHLAGSNFDDGLIGNVLTNKLLGLGGADTLDGGAGADTLLGGAGDDSLSGGEDDDRLFGDDGVDTLRGDAGDDRLFGKNGNDRLFGGGGNDSLFGNANADRLEGGAGQDALRGLGGNDRLFGGDGMDSLLGHTGNDIINGGNQSDILDGGAGNDQLFGDSGNDTIFGREGNDTIKGGSGADVVFGSTGADRITGGTGADTLTGNGGNDFYFYETGDDADTITDFQVGAGSQDVINLSGMGASFDTFTEVNAVASDDGFGNTVIDFGGGDTITLSGIAAASLHQDDFVF